MKKLFLILVISTGVLTVGAQTKTSSTTTRNVAPPKVTPTVQPFYFETKIAQGKISLSKAFKKTDDKSFVAVYAVVTTTARAADNTKSFPVTLSYSSFESTFATGSSDMIQKLPALKKYISDKSLSMTDEKSWISVIDYYNTL